jgi:hypothetical protein
VDFKQEGAAAVAADLIDLRAKITERANQVLEAHAIAFGLEKSEVVRKALDEWAERQIHISSVICRLTRSQGDAGRNRES